MSILVQSPRSPKTASILSLSVVIASLFWKENLTNSENILVVALGASILSTIFYSIEFEQVFNRFARERQPVLNTLFFDTERDYIYSKGYFITTILAFIIIRPQFIYIFNQIWLWYEITLVGMFLTGMLLTFSWQMYTKICELNQNLWAAYEWQRLVEEVKKRWPGPVGDSLDLLREFQSLVIGKDWNTLSMHLLRRRKHFKRLITPLISHAKILLNSFPKVNKEAMSEFNSDIQRLNDQLFSALSIRAAKLLELNMKIQRELKQLPLEQKMSEKTKTKIEQVISKITNYLDEIEEIGR